MLNKNLQKNKQKGFVNIFLLVGIILVVAVSYSAWKNKEEIVQNPDYPEYNAPNWTTYTNAEFGFRFTYPEEYSLQENTAFDAKDKVSKFQILVDKNISLDKPRAFEILIKDAKLDPLKKNVDWFKENFAAATISQENIRGNDFTIINFGDDSGSKVAYAEIDEFLYAISFTDESRSFLDSFDVHKPMAKVPNSNWQTYTNTKEGFRFVYPSSWYLYSLYSSGGLLSRSEIYPIGQDTEFCGFGDQIMFGASLMAMYDGNNKTTIISKEELIERNFSEAKKKEWINKNGMETLRVESEMADCSGNVLSYSFFKGNNHYYFDLSPYESVEANRTAQEQQNYEDFEKIVNSFRFTK